MSILTILTCILLVVLIVAFSGPLLGLVLLVCGLLALGIMWFVAFLVDVLGKAIAAVRWVFVHGDNRYP
ncbi:hypothetical protein BSL82_03815 [Tardibacter chloracetimidivorans]|uniref:Uncharacterized protein n=1 Tax=Tardibacter chloracetimidivorans TaxID=1921510 RepID=A0A1L3ZSE9_9SPHN|nr:hypothetical protein [Tardibacter chloracetimidivorans]API58544.1 hypothetical protein BSL82_03815 [Tardibacter chloracetimidivorans]